jgi:hypothetical protein
VSFTAWTASYMLPAHPFLAYTSALTHLLAFGSKETKPAPWVSGGKTGPSYLINQLMECPRSDIPSWGRAPPLIHNHTPKGGADFGFLLSLSLKFAICRLPLHSPGMPLPVHPPA